MAMLSSGFGKVIFGAGILSLTFVAVASGRDLIRQDGNSSPNSLQANSTQASFTAQASLLRAEAANVPATINRAAKADRAKLPSGSGQATHTVAMRLNDLANTSVAIRVPVASEAAPAATSMMKSGESKPSACEPVVSVLTEVAKKLQPGRCVT